MTHTLKNLCIILMILLVPTITIAQGAPLGLKWGMNPEAVLATETTFDEHTTDGRLSMAKTATVPKPISIAEKYLLIFDKDAGLQKIVIIGEDIENDLYGMKGKEQYDRFKNILTEKYGVAKHVYEYSGGALFDDSDEFYQCLAYEGCGTWASFFKNDTEKAIIALKGVRRGVGYLKITIEGAEWGACLDKARAEEKSADSDAL